MRKIVLAGLAMLAVDSSHSESSSNIDPSHFLCIVEVAGGLHFSRTNKVWEETQFKPGHKYIIRRSTQDDERGKYGDTYKRESIRNRPATEPPLRDYLGEALSHRPGAEALVQTAPAPAPKEIADWLIFDIDSKYADLAVSVCWDTYVFGDFEEIVCDDGFSFDKKTLRFQVTYDGGYLEQGSAQYEKDHPSPPGQVPNPSYKQFLETAEKPDDAAFSIGKCAPF
jgi:hypothetical protein